MVTFSSFLNEEQLMNGRWHEYVKDNPYLSAAIDILTELEKMGGSAYIVGGAVRDLVLGNDMHDVDIATNVPIEKINSKFKTHDIGQSKSFGIVTVTHKGFNFEIAQFREDGEYKNGRSPESVKIVLDFKTDAGRRDFTINSMAIDKDGNIIDHFDGMSDIKNKTIRTVGNPNDRFEEDRLRLLRLARFASKLDFKIDPSAKEAAKTFAPKIKDLSAERVRDELFKTAGYGGKELATFIEHLDEMGLLEQFLPEVSDLKKFEHMPTSHPEGPDIISHVLAALRSSPSKDPLVNLAILFHDIGKTKTRTYNDKGIVQYLRHAYKSAEMVEDIGRRLRFSNDQTKTLVFATLNHMKFHEILNMSNSKIWKLVQDKDFDTLVKVAKADWMARGELFNTDEWEAVLKKIETVKSKMTPTEYDNLRKLVSGKKIMDMLGIGPSAQVGQLIKDAVEWAIDNEIKDVDQIYDHIKKKHSENI